MLFLLTLCLGNSFIERANTRTLRYVTEKVGPEIYPIVKEELDIRPYKIRQFFETYSYLNFDPVFLSRKIALSEDFLQEWINYDWAWDQMKFNPTFTDDLVKAFPDKFYDIPTLKKVHKFGIKELKEIFSITWDYCHILNCSNYSDNLKLQGEILNTWEAIPVELFQIKPYLIKDLRFNIISADGLLEFADINFYFYNRDKWSTKVYLKKLIGQGLVDAEFIYSGAFWPWPWVTIFNDPYLSAELIDLAIFYCERQYIHDDDGISQYILSLYAEIGPINEGFLSNQVVLNNNIAISLMFKNKKLTPGLLEKIPNLSDFEDDINQILVHNPDPNSFVLAFPDFNWDLHKIKHPYARFIKKDQTLLTKINKCQFVTREDFAIALTYKDLLDLDDFFYKNRVPAFVFKKLVNNTKINLYCTGAYDDNFLLSLGDSIKWVDLSNLVNCRDVSINFILNHPELPWDKKKLIKNRVDLDLILTNPIFGWPITDFAYSDNFETLALYYFNNADWDFDHLSGLWMMDMNVLISYQEKPWNWQKLASNIFVAMELIDVMPEIVLNVTKINQPWSFAEVEEMRKLTALLN